MQNSFPLGAIIRRIDRPGIAKSNDNFLRLTPLPLAWLRPGAVLTGADQFTRSTLPVASR